MTSDADCRRARSLSRVQGDHATQRERWLLRAAEIMEDRKDDLINCLIDEIGSTVSKANFEFTKGLAMLRAAAGMCRNVRGETIPSDRPGTFRCRSANLWALWRSSRPLTYR